jgi:hypothetical protein
VRNSTSGSLCLGQPPGIRDPASANEEGWPSKRAADELYESEEYRPHREARRAGARNEFLLVSGEDVNGVARIAG